MKKEEIISYPAETYQINEPRTNNINRVVIVPYGYPKNFNLTNARSGDILHFKDDVNATIEGISTISTSSPLFEAVCKMIYGLPAVDVMKHWKSIFNNDIQYDHALFITYKLMLRCKK